MKIGSYGNEATDIHSREMPEEGSDSVLKNDGNYYPQVILKECKYIEKKANRYIADDLWRTLWITNYGNFLKKANLYMQNTGHLPFKRDARQKKVFIAF